MTPMRFSCLWRIAFLAHHMMWCSHSLQQAHATRYTAYNEIQERLIDLMDARTQMQATAMEMASGRSATAGVALAYECYRRAILAHLIRLVEERATAEDLCQDTFLKAFCCWEQRDPTKPIRTWLYRIATNVAYDYLRRCRRHPSISLDAVPDLLDGRQDVETSIAERRAVHRTLACLTPHDSTLLLRAHVAAESQQRIAADLGCCYRTLRVRLYRARARFRRVYRVYH